MRFKYKYYLYDFIMFEPLIENTTNEEHKKKIDDTRSNDISCLDIFCDFSCCFVCLCS